MQSNGTVNNQKLNETGNIRNKPRFGRPKVLNNRDIRLLIRKVKTDPEKSAPTLATEMATETKKMVHAKMSTEYQEAMAIMEQLL